MELRLIADQALGESAEDDHAEGLGFGVYARVLAQAALDTRGPFTIGVFGEWGAGKTSLMHMIEQQLAGNPDVVTVWFNAWRYEREEHPIVALVATIIAELEAHKSRAPKLSNSLAPLIRALRAIAFGFSVKSAVKVPGIAELEASFVGKDIIERAEQLRADQLLEQSLYYGAFKALASVGLPADARIVVLIDDLDRCFPDQAIRLLESIKLVLAQQGFIFVVGVARQVIEGYLQHRYSSDFGITDFKGRLYLDKIVQLPFHIPSGSGRIADFCERILASQPREVSEQLSGVMVTAAEALGANPRAVIRFLNNILVDLAIHSAMADIEKDMTRIPIDYFAISRCLEHGWPELFQLLTGSRELAGEVATWGQSEIDGYAKEGTGPKGRVAVSLMYTKLADLLLSDRGRSWLSDSDVRSATINFIHEQRSPAAAHPGGGVAYDAFLCYSTRDRADVVSLAQALSARGLSVSFSVDESPLSAKDSPVANSLDRSRVLCVCMGRSDLDAWVREVLDVVNPDRVLPIVLPGASASVKFRDLPGILRDRNWADLSQGISDRAIDDLVHVIELMGK
jgi:KAP-like P-loop domain-containing protein/TIR domain-containing protein